MQRRYRCKVVRARACALRRAEFCFDALSVCELIANVCAELMMMKTDG